MSSVGSWGWGGAYGTWYRVDPEERLTIVLMFQMIPNDTDLRDKFDVTLFQALVN
jgi:CubicO group peptidase (beta-lactamase class C family)